MTADELQNEIAQVQVLRHLTYPALRRIVQTGRLVQARAGQTVIGPGFGSRGFFVILSGSVAVLTSGATPLAYLGPKQYFGEIALLEGVERTATCKAQNDTVLFEVPPQTFHADIVSNPMVKAGMAATAKLRRSVQASLKSTPPAPTATARPVSATLSHPPMTPSLGRSPLTAGISRPSLGAISAAAAVRPRTSLYATA